MSVVLTPVAAPATGGKVRLYGVLSTFPPTPCAPAMFSAVLARGQVVNGDVDRSKVTTVQRGAAGPGSGWPSVAARYARLAYRASGGARSVLA